MFFIRVIPRPGGGLDQVQVTDETFRFLYEIDGRKPAINWLIEKGCCPGAAACIFDCTYGQVYNINSPAGRGDPGI